MPSMESPARTHQRAGCWSWCLPCLAVLLAGGCTPEPTGLSYPVNPATYTLGETIQDNSPSVHGGPATSYSIRPPLSAGLALDAATGIISGTPAELSPPTDYVVTASGPNGSTTVTLTITVNDVPPSALRYPASPAVYTLGQAIADAVPSSSGGQVVSYSIAPAIPDGLRLGASTGVISGTPAVLSPAATYTVTATNSGGSTSAAVSIAVVDVPPSDLRYAASPAVYTLGQAIAAAAPSSSGGPVVSYFITPPLPGGLHLNTFTGVISGIPAVLSPAATYMVTATNSGGSTSAAVSIVVVDLPPAGLTYSTSPAVYRRGNPIPNNVPSSSGGPVVSYQVAPALPAGLSLDPETGVLAGTPTELVPETSYTVTATNSGGSTTTLLTIAVRDVVVGLSGMLATGYGHTCAVVNGSVECWGSNIAGQLGDGSTNDHSVAVVVSGLGAGAQAVTAGSGHTCAVVNGGVWCWGLGNPAPVQVSGLAAGVQAIAAGQDYTCALVNGGVQCWGRNADGQLGDGTTTDRFLPGPVLGLGAGVQAITAGTLHTCAVVNGGAWCWGYNNTGQLGNGSAVNSLVPVQVSGLTSGVQAIAAGYDHTCALVDGGVWCWGRNFEGQLGNGSSTYSLVPVQVSGLSSGVQAIAAGWSHTCAIAGGGLRCWGANYFGQLGDGSTTDGHTPVQVSGLSSGVQAVAASWGHTCALVDGGLRCWGTDQNGQLGDGSTTERHTPVQVSGLSSGVQAIAARADHGCALVNGGVRCWGSNSSGQLGDGSTTDHPVPVQVSGLSSGVQAIATGAYHTCAIVDGGAWCWGSNSSGQLGDGSTTDRPLPVQVSGLASGVQAIAAGTYHTCALVNGGARCWGDNSGGQLGSGASGPPSSVPVQVTNLTSGVQAVAAGFDHTCAIVDGSARCWGSNGSGQLGNGSSAGSAVPVQVSGLTAGVQAISAGELSHDCALVNGGVQCWGANGSGQLGNGSVADSPVPVQVSGLASGALAIAAGWSHMCALVGGGVRCWGANSSGQLGNGSTTSSQVPVQVPGLASGIWSMTAGGLHTCALGKGGDAMCWGANLHGQLGNGASGAPSLAPVPVTSWGL